MAAYNDSKEFFLNEIEKTATWRAVKAQQFPQDAERSMMANHQLLELYAYVEKLSADHQIFHWHKVTSNDSIEQWISAKLRMYGLQSKKESPKGFIARLEQEGLNEGLIDQILDSLNS